MAVTKRSRNEFDVGPRESRQGLVKVKRYGCCGWDLC